MQQLAISFDVRIGEHYERTMCFGWSWRFLMYDDGDLFLFSTIPLTEEVWPVSFSHLRGHPSSNNTIVTLVTRRQSLKTKPVSCLQYVLYILLTIVLLLFNFRSLCFFFCRSPDLDVGNIANSGARGYKVCVNGHFRQFGSIHGCLISVNLILLLSTSDTWKSYFITAPRGGEG